KTRNYNLVTQKAQQEEPRTLIFLLCFLCLLWLIFFLHSRLTRIRPASPLPARDSLLPGGNALRACRESLRRDVQWSCGTRTTAWRFACWAARAPALKGFLLRAGSGLPGANEWQAGGRAEVGFRPAAADGAAPALQPARHPGSEKFPAHIWSS